MPPSTLAYTITSDSVHFDGYKLVKIGVLCILQKPKQHSGDRSTAAHHPV